VNDNLSVLNYIIASCKLNKNSDEAKTLLKIIFKNCNDLIVLDRVGFLQSEIKDYENCVKTLRTSLSLANNKESKFSIRANLAKMYNHLNEPMMSLAFSKMNAEDHFEYDTLMEMAFSYYLMGDYTQSEKMMRELDTDKNLPVEVRGRVEYNLGSYDIEAGNFKIGLKKFVDVGHKIKIWPPRYTPNVPIWQGEDISGKTLIIHSEGGIGDELINVRFVKNIKDLGATPIWITNNNDLCEVFNRNGIDTRKDIKNIDLTNAVQCMAMYLPISLNLDETQVWYGPYLKPSQEYIEKWKKILPEGKKLAVKWSGNPFYDQDLHRSIPLDIVQNIEYNGTKVNLQLEPELYQENMFNAGEHIKNIEDTLALLFLCDNLLTSCTSIVHMNGAMGKNGIVCPPIASYYVWLGTKGNYSNWYDKSLQVFRQTKHRDWKFVESLTL
jgi:tetratricopeptide (TPR) repeat protein